MNIPFNTLNNVLVPSKKIVNYALHTSFSGAIPIDDTIPQIGEGTQIFSQAISLKSAASTVLVKVAIQGSTDTANAFLVISAFRNAAADAVGSSIIRLPSVELNQGELLFMDSPATQGSVTYTIRLGISAGTFTTNGNSVSRFLGGASKCALSIEEILP